MAEFLSTERHPRFARPYGELYFEPMAQLIDFLGANGFTVYIVSGSQQGFTRTFAHRVLGLPPERAVGHAVELDFSVQDGKASLLRQDAFLAPSIDGGGKAEVIRQRFGRRPILAFGNSMGDFEMLQYATIGDGPGLALILVHDDEDEYVYRNTELEKHADELGWLKVSMQDDFETLFPATVSSAP